MRGLSCVVDDCLSKCSNFKKTRLPLQIPGHAPGTSNENFNFLDLITLFGNFIVLRVLQVLDNNDLKSGQKEKSEAVSMIGEPWSNGQQLLATLEGSITANFSLVLLIKVDVLLATENFAACTKEVMHTNHACANNITKAQLEKP